MTESLELVLHPPLLAGDASVYLREKKTRPSDHSKRAELPFGTKHSSISVV